MHQDYFGLQPVKWSQEEKRCAVVMILCQKGDDISDSEIANLTGVDRKRVWELRKMLKETKDPRATVTRVARDPKSSRTVRKPEFVAEVTAIFEENPGISMNEVARQKRCNPQVIQNIVKDDMRCKSYKLKTGQLLTEKAKNARLVKGTKLLNKLKHPKEKNMLWFFSDEKNFCQDQRFNRQNQRWIAACPGDVIRVMKTKFPQTVMVFEVISSEGDVMPPHIFDVGLKVNTEVYLQVMNDVVLPWIRNVAGDRPWVWQQDSAPAHVSKRSISWLKENCFDFVDKTHWPPNSPNLNPLDYFLWGYLELRTNKEPHNTKDALIAAISREAAEIPPGLVRNACARFRGRIEAVLASDGGWI